MADDTGLLKKQLADLWPRFKDFRDGRVLRDSLINRRSPVVLDDSIAKYGDGIDLETPDLEWAIHQHASILRLNGTKIDISCMEDSQDARDDCEDIRYWDACSWAKQNDGRKIDKRVGMGQVQYGVAIERKLWHMPEEPDDDDLKGYLPEISRASTERQRERAREAYYREQCKDCFDLVSVSPMDCAWFPVNEEPDLFIMNVVLPYVEATKLENDHGDRLTLDDYGKIAFIGAAEHQSDVGADTITGELQMISLIIRDAKDPKTGEWKISEYVCPDGGDLGEATKIREYVNPLGRCSFSIIPEGGMRPSQNDPHLRYRCSHMEGAYVAATEQNYWRTLLGALARKKVSDEDVYFDISTMTPEQIQQLDGSGWVEGAGTKRRWTFRRSEAGTGEIVGMPHLEKWPNDLEPHLELMLEQTNDMLKFYMPNRFLTGQAFDEAKEAPATSTLSQTQGAALPYGDDLVESDTFIKHNLEAEHHAICFWDKASADQKTMKVYPVTTSGDEPTHGAEPGKTVVIDAQKLKRSLTVQVTTTNITAAEKAQNDQTAYMDYDRNTINEEQLLKRLGHDDPRKQIELLDEQRMRNKYQERYEGIEMQAIETLFSALSGLNLTAMAGGDPSTQDPAMQDPSMQASGESLPTGWARPQMTPPPIAGPTGGASPMAGPV